MPPTTTPQSHYTGAAARRRKVGLTQGDAARLAGVSFRTVERVDQGQTWRQTAAADRYLAVIEQAEREAVPS